MSDKCRVCGGKMTTMRRNSVMYREVYEALTSGKCPRCGSRLVRVDDFLVCPNNDWDVAIDVSEGGGGYCG